jgi:microcystin-dependent protein
LWLIKGVLAALTKEWNYEKFGDMTPEETAEAYSTILKEIKLVTLHEVGTAVFSLRETNPSNWIPCMGQNLAMDDWPELMDVYPAALKNYPTAGQFFVPDLRGRMLVGDGTDGFGFNWPFLSVGGSRTVTLTQAQMPAHTHGESIAIPAVINGGLEAPASAATASTGTTGTAGSGQSHDNMPPYGVCHMFIVGRLFE